MRSDSKTKKSVSYAGASTRGPGHKLSNTPNQDAWIFRELSWGFVGVVADGLGSHAYSQIGSKAVCRSVIKAINLWRKYPASPEELLLQLIHNIWQLELGSNDPSLCGTTCLFVCGIADQDKLVVGQLGDGIVYLQLDEASRVITNKTDEYTNLTSSIHNSKISDWICESICIENRKIRLLLATDGISEDLIQSRINDFVDYVDCGAMEKKTQAEKNMFVKRMQIEWPTPMHSDDKTLLMIKVGDLNVF